MTEAAFRRPAICFLIALLAVQEPIWGQRTRFEPGRNQVMLVHNERIRTALVYLPAHRTVPDSGWPVVLMLHGGGGSAQNTVDATGWEVVGDREGFIAAFPNGTPKDEGLPASFLLNPQTWNCGPGVSLAAGEESAAAKDIDDVGFLISLIRMIQQNAPVDPRRIYVCGHSNGAAMAYRLGYERSDVVAAIGVMAGHFFLRADSAIGPVSLLQIVGDKDPFTPMGGGMAGVGRTKAPMPPALEGPRSWARALRIDTSRSVVSERTDLAIHVWGPNACGAEVRSIVVKGHGHGYLWPDGKTLPKILIGPTVNAINATETFWKFFKAHPKADCPR
jgi:polyhydroxybutyrate depolymerase